MSLQTPEYKGHRKHCLIGFKITHEQSLLYVKYENITLISSENSHFTAVRNHNLVQSQENPLRIVVSTTVKISLYSRDVRNHEDMSFSRDGAQI